MDTESPEHLKYSAKVVEVYVLERWIREAEWTIAELRMMAEGKGTPSPLLKTIEAMENDLVVYREELLQRSVEKAPRSCCLPHTPGLSCCCGCHKR